MAQYQWNYYHFLIQIPADLLTNGLLTLFLGYIGQLELYGNVTYIVNCLNYQSDSFYRYFFYQCFQLMFMVPQLAHAVTLCSEFVEVFISRHSKKVDRIKTFINQTNVNILSVKANQQLYYQSLKNSNYHFHYLYP